MTTYTGGKVTPHEAGNPASVEVGTVEDDPDIDEEPFEGHIALVATGGNVPQPTWIVNGAFMTWSGARIRGNGAAPNMTLQATENLSPRGFNFRIVPAGG